MNQPSNAGPSPVDGPPLITVRLTDAACCLLSLDDPGMLQARALERVKSGRRHDLVDRQFGSVEARGWEISGHAIVLEHQTTHLRGQLEAHAYDNGAPVVEVKCWAEITVTIVEVTRRKARR